MKKIMVLILMLAVGMQSSVLAESISDFDPLQRNLVFVEGNAELVVPVDFFSVSFGFDVESASFVEAQRESERITAAIEGGLKPLGLQNVEVIRGWDLVRQARISLGAKGRKISNRVVIRAAGFPQNQTHALIAAIIDSSLQADKAVGLENVDVKLSDSLENQKKGEALTAALKALQVNAEKAAAASGRKLIGAKRIFVMNGEGLQELRRDRAVYSDIAYESAAKLSQSFISVQKSFRVQGEIVDQMSLKAKVAGIYEIE